MGKKYKHISDLDDHSGIDSSDSAGMNMENPYSNDRESNTDRVENVDNANNVRRSSRTQHPLIRFGEAYKHRKKLMKVGRICGIYNGVCSLHFLSSNEDKHTSNTTPDMCLGRIVFNVVAVLCKS